MQWVESKKLPPTYREVTKDTVVNPEKQTAYNGRFLRIANEKISITVGETRQLNPPAGATVVSWSSDNATVASVNNGVVTGVKAGGPVTITCTYTEAGSATPTLHLRRLHTYVDTYTYTDTGDDPHSTGGPYNTGDDPYNTGDDPYNTGSGRNDRYTYRRNREDGSSSGESQSVGGGSLPYSICTGRKHTEDLYLGSYCYGSPKADRCFGTGIPERRSRKRSNSTG